MPVERSRLELPSVRLAPRLLGARVSSVVGGHTVVVRLTEVEAYEGTEDAASHAYRGPTARTAVMFGPAGHLYAYFTYGMHWCANIVCDVEGRASAVLLRAGDVISGLDTARRRRPAARRDDDLARGPARLATCLGIDRAVNGVDLLDPASPVQLISLARPPRSAVMAGPRVGITRAIEHPWRFWLDGAPSVSQFRAGGRKPIGPARQTGLP